MTLLILIAAFAIAAQTNPAAEDMAGLEARLDHARELRLQGSTNQALQELQGLLKSVKGRLEFRDFELNVKSEMSDIYLSQNDLAQAAAGLEEISAGRPKDALVHYKLGLVYRDLGDNRRATLHLQAAIDGGFDNLAARLNLIEAAFASKQSATALEMAERVISTGSKSPDSPLRLGRLLFEHLFYKEALKAFQLAQQAAPDAFEPRFRLALTYYLLEEYAAAVATLKPLEASEFSPEADALAASAEAKLGHFEAAAAILRRSIERAPKSPHAYINLALIDLDRGDVKEAEALLERVRVLDVKSGAKVFYTVGRNSCRAVASAVERGEVPIHPSPEKAEFYYELASQLQEGFNYLSAVELIRLAQANEGNSVRVLYIAGTSCLNQDPLSPEPILFLRKAVSLDPNLHKAYYLLGRVYTRQGKLDEAVAAYRRAAELYPNASYYVELGKALGRSGTANEQSSQDAIAAYHRALVLDPSNAAAYLELGRLLIQLGKFDEARPELEKALDLEPDFYEADYLLGRLLYRLGDETQSGRYLALFKQKKTALLQQSIIGAGFVGDGH
jgi:superkiller protein 3